MMQVNRWIQDHIGVLKASVFALCLLPFVLVTLAAFQIAGFDLGANPVEAIIHRMGLWGLRLLLLTLAITPARMLSGWIALTRFRRMLGLFAFFYVSLHFLAYAWIDQRWAWQAIVEDILERPYITIGVLALLLLLPLALTSTKAMMRRLGRRWQQLHRLVYPIAILGVWHFWWQVKQDILEPALYVVILGALLGHRLHAARRRQQRAAGAGN